MGYRKATPGCNGLSLSCVKKISSVKKNTMSWENILAALTCGRDKMPSQDAIRVLLNNGTDERRKD